MPSEHVLIEIEQGQLDAFEAHAAALPSTDVAYEQAAGLVSDLAGLGLELTEELAPIRQAEGLPVGVEAFATGDRCSIDPCLNVDMHDEATNEHVRSALIQRLDDDRR